MHSLNFIVLILISFFLFLIVCHAKSEEDQSGDKSKEESQKVGDVKVYGSNFLKRFTCKIFLKNT